MLNYQLMKTTAKNTLLPWQIEAAAALRKMMEAHKKSTGMTKEVFAEKYNLGSAGNLGHYIHGRQPINLTAALRFAKGLGCDVTDIHASFAEEMEWVKPSPSDSGSLDSLPQPTEDEFALVQQLDLSASCGNGRFSDHVVVKGGLAFKRSSLHDIGVSEEHSRIIYANGDSMEPSIGSGRVVLIDTNDNDPIDNKIFLICDPDGSILLKRLVREFHPGSGEMRWIMRSDNNNKLQYPDKLLPDDERTHIIGRAVWTDKML